MRTPTPHACVSDWGDYRCLGGPQQQSEAAEVLPIGPSSCACCADKPPAFVLVRLILLVEMTHRL